MEVKRYAINEELAKTAKSINSFNKYVPGEATKIYNAYIDEFQSAVNVLIERNQKTKYPATPEQMEKVAEYADRYSIAISTAIDTQNRIESMCPSVLICGAGNFPVAKKERQNKAREAFYAKSGELFKPTGNYYYKKINDILTDTTIYSDDPLAIEKLKSKLSELEEKQKSMKECNAYYRKHKTMKGYEGLTDEQAERLDEEIKESYSWAQQPFPAFQLTNNNAAIKRTRERIAELERMMKTEETASESKYPVVPGVEVVENAEAMRIQLIFDGKPDDETRTLLKSSGFKWSPRFAAWQRQLNDNGIRAAQKVLSKLQ